MRRASLRGALALTLAATLGWSRSTSPASTATTRPAAAEKILPARDEPKHQVVLANDYVRVLDLRIPAGEETRFHTHDVATVIVALTQCVGESQARGETAWTPRTIIPGDSRYAPYDEAPLTHRVRNPGPGLFRVYDIELLHLEPAAESFALPDTPALRQRWREKRARALTLRLDAGGHRTVAPSGCAHLFVGLAGTATITAAGGGPRDLRPQELHFHPPRTGFVVGNGTEQPSETLILELK